MSGSSHCATACNSHTHKQHRGLASLCNGSTWRQGTVSSCERQSFLLCSHVGAVCSSSCQVSYDWFFVQLTPGWPSPSSAQSTPLSSTGSRAVTTGEKTWLWLVAEQSYRWLYREHIRPLCMRRSHLLQHSPPLGQRSWCGKRENHPLKRKRAEPNFQGFYCSTWNQILSLTGLWQLLGREEILPKSQSSSSSSVSSHIHYQNDSCHHIPRKDLLTGVQVKSKPLNKSTGHVQSAQGHSHIRTPNKDHHNNCST